MADLIPVPAIGCLLAASIALPLEAWAQSDERCSGAPHPPGLATYQIQGTALRRYAVYVPRSLDPASPATVIFDFHGSGSNPRQELQLSGTDSLAERHGLLVLLPYARIPYAGGGHTWNVPAEPGRPDDVRLVEEILADAAGRVCLDDTRLYLVGFSGGARLASHLACKLSHRVAAVALVGGVRAPAGCGRGAVAVLAFHGTADPVNPYDGGGPPYWGHSVETAVAGWAKQTTTAGRACGSAAGRRR